MKCCNALIVDVIFTMSVLIQKIPNLDNQNKKEMDSNKENRRQIEALKAAGSKGRCQVSGSWCQVAGVRYQVPGIRRQVPRFWCQMQASGTRFQVPGFQVSACRWHFSVGSKLYIAERFHPKTFIFIYLQLRLGSLHLGTQKQPFAAVLI